MSDNGSAMLAAETTEGCLNHLLKMAGNPKLMNPPLLQTLCEHAAGNLRLKSSSSRFAPDPKPSSKRS
jgi:hypothetical protein